MTEDIAASAKPSWSLRLERVGPWTEMAGAIVLSVAALTTSWASFQSELWDGDQAAAYSQAEALRTEAARKATEAGQILGADVLLFTNWLTAYAAGDVRLQTFYEDNFRLGFRPVHEAWLAKRPQDNRDVPRTPFTMPEYEIPARAEAEALQEQADALFQKGQRANEISDRYISITVILAAALFFGGIGQVFRTLPVRVALLCIAAGSCVWGLLILTALPVN